MPGPGVLKLGTRPLADSWRGQASRSASAGLGLEAPRPAHPLWEPAYFWG